MLVAILVGAMTEGCEGWQEWPIDPSGCPQGPGVTPSRHATSPVHRVADHARGGSSVEANQLGRRPEIRRLAVAIADELERVEVLTAQDLEAVIATTQETWSTEV